MDHPQELKTLLAQIIQRENDRGGDAAHLKAVATSAAAAFAAGLVEFEENAGSRSKKNDICPAHEAKNELLWHLNTRRVLLSKSSTWIETAGKKLLAWMNTWRGQRDPLTFRQSVFPAKPDSAPARKAPKPED